MTEPAVFLYLHRIRLLKEVIFMKAIVKGKSQFEQVATRVSIVCMIGNLLLAAAKFVAGFLGHSGAMISDAVHSTSDIIGSAIVVVGVRISTRPSDKSHPYGHERMECIAALLLGNVLALIGLSIGWQALGSIYSGSYRTFVQPGAIAVCAAFVSIVSKEAMFWYTWKAAGKINSTSLKAEAWHHRSDAMSSVGALIGIIGARHGYLVLEPLASVVISLLILKAAAEIFKDAVNKVVDHSCDEATQQALRDCVTAHPGVRGLDLLNTREFGNRIYVDMEISADAALSLREAHSIAEGVHELIERQFPQVKHVMVHVNPA